MEIHIEKARLDRIDDDETIIVITTLPYNEGIDREITRRYIEPGQKTLSFVHEGVMVTVSRATEMDAANSPEHVRLEGNLDDTDYVFTELASRMALRLFDSSLWIDWCEAYKMPGRSVTTARTRAAAICADEAEKYAAETFRGPEHARDVVRRGLRRMMNEIPTAEGVASPEQCFEAVMTVVNSLFPNPKKRG